MVLNWRTLLTSVALEKLRLCKTNTTSGEQQQALSLANFSETLEESECCRGFRPWVDVRLKAVKDVCRGRCGAGINGLAGAPLTRPYELPYQGGGSYLSTYRQFNTSRTPAAKNHDRLRQSHGLANHGYNRVRALALYNGIIRGFKYQHEAGPRNIHDAGSEEATIISHHNFARIKCV
ncbi:hypothetical protein BDD12DRAFT_494577 [Trichophaea hybrida]|nr:hypothetical protein BDD12DRAFT_494577 [Trichophaea hybrida]